MATVFDQTTFTTEQLLAMPDDGRERWIIDGELREKPMTVRNKFHSEVTATVTYYLERWNRDFAKPRGVVANGEAGFRLLRDPDSTVGVDVALTTRELARQQSDETTLYDGPPLLAVEVLSPNDTQQDIHEKIRKYLEAGTKMVWVIDPEFPTVTVYEKDKSPVMFNREQEVSGEPHFPGLRLPVGELLP